MKEVPRVKIAIFNLPETVSAAILVIGGEFGNGEERKRQLEEAGYNYKEVQTCVNELLPILEKYER